MSDIQLLRRLVRQQTVNIGARVSNLYGAVAGESPAVLVQQEQTFLVAQIAGTRLVSPEEFYAIYVATTERKYQVIQATEGLIVASSLNTSGTPSTFLVRSSVELPAAINIPLSIETDSPTSSFAVYIDGVLLRRGNGSMSLTVSFSQGRHILEIVAVARVFGLAVPSTVRFIHDLEKLSAPVWAGYTTGYLDPVSGTVVVELEWFTDPRAGGWILYRKVITDLGVVNSVGLLDENHEFYIQLEGNSPTISAVIGAQISVGGQLLGVVLNAGYDSDADKAQIRIKASDGLEETRQDWIGRYATIASFSEVARVNRTISTNTVKWSDIAVKVGTTYEYTLQSFGLFDHAQLSPMSSALVVVPGDDEAPNSIVFLTGYPVVDGGQVIVKFTTPTDADYEGVRVVYIDYPPTGFGTANTGTSASQLVDNEKAWTPNEFAGYIIEITANTGVGLTTNIASNTETTLTFSPEFPIALDDTSTYQIYRVINIVTDYGIPNTLDELRFNIIGAGRYYFCTFDRAQNIQRLEDAAYWDYDSTYDLTTPLTDVLVYDRTETGEQSQTVVGMTLYSVPPATEELLDTFEAADSSDLSVVDSGTFDISGNTTKVFTDGDKSWTTDQWVNYVLRIYSEGANYNRIVTIIAMSGTEVEVDFDIPVPPNGMSYQILGHAPKQTPTATEYWTVSNPGKLAIRDSQLEFVGVAGESAVAHIDALKASDLRYEAKLYRGGTGHASIGTNLVYKANAAATHRWEYGAIHVDSDFVRLRYRYNSGGTGNWTDLDTAYQWTAGTARKLIVEIDDDIHTFRIADAYGHNEKIVGRISVGGTPTTDTKVGWYVSGNPSVGEILGDVFDEARVMDTLGLVRIRYKLLPQDDFLEVPYWNGTVYSGSPSVLVDNTKLWIPSELVGLYLRITGGTAVGSDSVIAANTYNTIIPETNFFAALDGTSEYLVYDKYYTGTERLRWWATRETKVPMYLLYHGERLGITPEPEHRMLIDPNKIAEIELSLTQIAYGPTEGTIRATIVPDDDVAYWRLLMRKAQWPTADGTDTTVPDMQYAKFGGEKQDIIEWTTTTLVIGNGLWYAIAVPYDTNGVSGVAVFASLEVVDTAPTAPPSGKTVKILVQPPLATTSGVAIPSPVPVVYLTDESGAVVQASGVSITASSTDSVLTFSGTTVEATDAFGYASFDNLILTGTNQQGDRITFSAGGYNPAISTIVYMGSAPTKSLSITQQPSAALYNKTMTPIFVVGLYNTDGTLDTVTGQLVTATASNGYGLQGGSAYTTNGLAYFTDMRLATGDTIGTTQITFASSGYTGTTSNVLNVLPEGLYSFTSLTATRISGTNNFIVKWSFPAELASPSTLAQVDIFIKEKAIGPNGAYLVQGENIWYKEQGSTATEGNAIALAWVVYGGKTVTTLYITATLKIYGLAISTSQIAYSFTGVYIP